MATARIIRFVLRSCMAAMFCLLVVSARAEEVTVRLGYSEIPAPPWQIGHDQSPPGIAFEVIREVGARLGIRFEFIRYPNKRVLWTLGKNELEGAFMYSYEPERTRQGVYPERNGLPDPSRRLATLSYYLYRMKGEPVIWDGKTVRGGNIVIGANEGYSIAEDLRQLGLKVFEARGTEKGFRMLQLGRISAMAHQDCVADPWLAAHDPEGKIEKLEPPLRTKHYYLIFSHAFMEKHRDLAMKIWDEIAVVRDTVMAKAMKSYQ